MSYGENDKPIRHRPAFYLAERGLDVLGIDFAERAVALARQRAKSLRPEASHLVEFRVDDALRPSRVERQFRSVFDSGFLHLFEPNDVDAFVDELATTLHPGGRYYLLAFAVEFAPPSPRAITEQELASRLGGFPTVEKTPMGQGLTNVTTSIG